MAHLNEGIILSPGVQRQTAPDESEHITRQLHARPDRGGGRVFHLSPFDSLAPERLTIFLLAQKACTELAASWNYNDGNCDGDVPMDRDSVIRLLMSERVSLLAWIRVMVRDEHLAEDILQEVSIVAVNKCEEVRDASAFPSWVRQVARFKALHMLRERRSIPAVVDEHTLTLLEPHWRTYDSSVSGDLTEFLRECLKLLGPDAHELVRLRHQEGKSGAFLAETLGRPVNTVYVTLSRAYKRLGDCIRKRLAEQDRSDG
jgi:RNA polymerase sigma-70 factor, ECF subfamily